MTLQAPSLASLASLSSELLVQVQELCLRTDRDATELSTSLNDASTRFRMWGYNNHAFQDDQTSLEYQIREALSLQKGFRQRLQDLKEDLADCEFCPGFHFLFLLYNYVISGRHIIGHH